MACPRSITQSNTLAELVSEYAGASRVLHREGMDFCRGGTQTLEEACKRARLDWEVIATEIEAQEAVPEDEFRSWKRGEEEELIQHILQNYHDEHRREVPQLIEMAENVERVHAEKLECPTGLARFLRQVEIELERHMQKEEQILFPLILSGATVMVQMPIQMMEEEHKGHAANLERLRELTYSYEVPDCACNTWRALMLRLRELEQQLMKHMHLENNVLFPSVLSGAKE